MTGPSSDRHAVDGLDAYAAIVSVEQRAREFPSLCRHLGQPRRRPFCDMLERIFVDELAVSRDVPADAVRGSLEDNEMIHGHQKPTLREKMPMRRKGRAPMVAILMLRFRLTRLPSQS